MKLVFTREEVAEALGQTVEAFDAALPRLEHLGFPKTVPGLEARWAIIDVMNWVSQDGPAQTQSRCHYPRTAAEH